MMAALLLPLGGLCATALTGCGDGITTSPPPPCVVEDLTPAGGTVSLGSVTLTVRPGALGETGRVSLCLDPTLPEEDRATAPVGPVFRVTSSVEFQQELTFEERVSIPPTAKKGIAPAYYRQQNAQWQRWEAFNTSDRGYDPGKQLLTGTVVKPARELVLGPVLVCGSELDCPSRHCFTGVCQ